jgi:hypothetical protein
MKIKGLALQDAANALNDVSYNEEIKRDSENPHERWFNHVRDILSGMFGARLLLNCNKFFKC